MCSSSIYITYNHQNETKMRVGFSVSNLSWVKVSLLYTGRHGWDTWVYVLCALLIINRFHVKYFMVGSAFFLFFLFKMCNFSCQVLKDGCVHFRWVTDMNHDELEVAMVKYDLKISTIWNYLLWILKYEIS